MKGRDILAMMTNFRDLPQLQNEMLLEMTPKCYYAHYDGVNELPKEVGGMWSYMWRMLPHNKPEKGIMILEDITKSPGRFRHLDKNKVPDIEEFLKVMESIAHFHGVWWQIVDDLRGKNNRKLHCDFKLYLINISSFSWKEQQINNNEI